MVRALWWIIPVLTVLAASIAPAAVFFVDIEFSLPFEGDPPVFFRFIAVLVLFVANIAQAIVMAVRKPQGFERFARGAALLLKVGLVPMYIVGVLLLGAFSLLVMGMPFILLLVPLIFLLGFMGLLAGSAWTVVACFGAWRHGRMRDCAVVALCVLSFVYVLDVAAAIAMFCLTRKKRPVHQPYCSA